MKTWKTLTITGVTLTAALLLISTVAAYCGPWGSGSYGYGGMMGGYSYEPYTSPVYPTQTTPTTPSTQYYQPVYPFQFGGGCMGTFGWNSYGYGHGYNTAPYTYTGAPLNITTAITISQNYVAALGNPDLSVANFYVQVYEKSTGIGAFELLINKYTGSIYPEMGPNMMWNTKYGMMHGGILSGIFGTPTAAMPLTAEQAEANAQQWLSAYIPGTTVGEAEPFYGYYRVMVLSAGEGYGMLSVNGYTGQVWFHNWHGAFIQELEVS
jgi:hypothetical protein